MRGGGFCFVVSSCCGGGFVLDGVCRGDFVLEVFVGVDGGLVFFWWEVVDGEVDDCFCGVYLDYFGEVVDEVLVDLVVGWFVGWGGGGGFLDGVVVVGF